MAELNGMQLAALRDALVAAYPEWDDLAAMFHAAIGQPLQNVVKEGALLHVAFDLVMWVQARGQLAQLLDGALAGSANPELRRVVEGLRVPAVEPALVGALALGELTSGTELGDRNVYVAAIVYDLDAFQARVAAHVERAAARPAVHRMAGKAAQQLRSEGYRPATVRGAIEDAFVDVVGTAPDLRVYAVCAAPAPRAEWAARRTVALAGMLGERFGKRDHGVTRVLALRERLADTRAAVAAAWNRVATGAAPAVSAESPAPAALCGICDVLAGVVHAALIGGPPIPRALRGKLVHIYDQVTRRNYSAADVFPAAVLA